MSVTSILRHWPHTENLGRKFLDEEIRGLAFTYGEIRRMREYEYHWHANELEQKVERWTREVWEEYEKFTWGQGCK